MDDAEAEIAVATALDLGYRLVDTASAYRNEVGVGRGVSHSGVDRSEVFVTTKLRGADQGFDRTIAGLKGSLERLGLDYVDLYLIHWPLPRVDTYVDSWRAMIQLRDEGLARSIGVSNFTGPYLDRLKDETGVVPVVNQIELNPVWNQSAMRVVDACDDIITESWSPLGRGLALHRYRAIADAARNHAKTPTQVALRWHLQLGALPIPKASSIEHQRENLDVFSFDLSNEEMAALSAIDQSPPSQDPETHEEF